MRNGNKVLVRKPEGKYFGDLQMHGRIILKWILINRV
jgi:hypothetical protein